MFAAQRHLQGPDMGAYVAQMLRAHPDSDGPRLLATGGAGRNGCLSRQRGFETPCMANRHGRRRLVGMVKAPSSAHGTRSDEVGPVRQRAEPAEKSPFLDIPAATTAPLRMLASSIWLSRLWWSG